MNSGIHHSAFVLTSFGLICIGFFEASPYTGSCKGSSVLPLCQDSRDMCWNCYRAKAVCFCSRVRPFKSPIEFVLLVHPKESRSRIGTARIVERSISNCRLLVGNGPEFDEHPEIQSLIKSDKHSLWLLFPGTNALNLSTAPLELVTERFAPDRIPVVFVVDGTWTFARKMIRESRFLQKLPQLMFEREQPSTYRFREQPHKLCLSTVEAVHTLIDLFEFRGICNSSERTHDEMLRVFDWIVQLQLAAKSPERI